MNNKHIIGTTWDEYRKRDVYIKIDTEIKDTNNNKDVLSISARIGQDQGGQCQDTIKELMLNDAIKYHDEWNKEKLFKLLEVWDNWHLNDMHPECEHQEIDGTLDEARQEATIYGHQLTDDATKAKTAIGERTERRGWINFSEYPTIGILGKPCATCGYKYGSAWKKRDLPADVINFITNL